MANSRVTGFTNCHLVIIENFNNLKNTSYDISIGANFKRLPKIDAYKINLRHGSKISFKEETG